MTGGCGAGQTATDMARFADAKETYLRGFLKLSAGLPSHDTFSRLFRLLDLVKFSAWFQRFTAAFDAELRGVIAVDGKVLRRSHDKARRKSALHMVSAWGCKAGLLLAQIATDAKSNEITAVPKLLAMLALKGTIVTVDALNCQRAIAAQIIAQGGDYALPLKENKPACWPMSACSWTIRRPNPTSATRASMPITAGSRPVPPPSRARSAGSPRPRNGPGCAPSASWYGSARVTERPAPRPHTM